MKRLFGAAVVACCAAAAWAGVKPGHVPDEAKWVLNLDLKALNESPMGAFIRQSLDENGRRGLASLQAMSGIDLTNDVDAIVVYGLGQVKDGGVLYAYGRFDVARLTAVAGAAKEYQNKVFGERSLLSWSDKGKRTHLCFIDPTLAVMAQSEELVQQAVSRIDGARGKSAGGPGPFAKVLTHTPGRFLAIQTSDTAALAGVNPQLQMLKKAEALLLEVGQLRGANGLEGLLAVKAPDAEAAQQMSQAAQGIQALFMLQAAQNPEAAAVAQDMKVSLEQDVVTVNLKLTEAALKKMVQVRIEQQQAAAAERRAARKAAKAAGEAEAAGGGEGGAEPRAERPERPAF